MLEPKFTEIEDRVELALIASGYGSILGCDEAGRGPLDGPVVASAVEFRDCDVIWKCKDSKSLTPNARAELFDQLVSSVRFSISSLDAHQIDELNIRVASLQAMTNAALDLSATPDLVLVDGRDRLPQIVTSRAIVKGDARVATIAAASIIAKVTRDRLMLTFHEQYPEYGFDRHFGYPTAEHRKKLLQFGPCPIHRRSYRGVRELVENS